MKGLQIIFVFVFILCCVFSVNADGITSIARTNSLLKKAEEAFKKGDYKQAINSYEGALKESDDLPPQANLNLGTAYFLSKDFEKAQKNYLSVIGTTASNPMKSIAYQQIGNIFSQKKEYKTALDWYKKSLKTNPQNEAARFNYELAYKLNQKEEEKKNQENQDQKNQPQKDKDQNQKDQQKKDESQNNQGKEGKEKEEQKGGKDKPGDQKQKQQQKGKDGKDGPEKENQGQKDEQGEEKDERNKDSKTGKEETEDKEGKENSAKKTQEADNQDLNAVRVDKKKLMESGLTEEQAKSLLQAMRQSEVKYLQQRRFGSKKGGSSGRVRW